MRRHGVGHGTLQGPSRVVRKHDTVGDFRFEQAITAVTAVETLMGFPVTTVGVQLPDNSVENRLGA